MRPKIELISLRLSVETEYGQFGRDIAFSSGLNLLRANNNSGKSTALQAIIYALGLEGMLSPSFRVPLAHVMTDYLDLPDRKVRVIRSRVKLAIRNSLGESITIVRSVKDSERSPYLITVQFDHEYAHGEIASPRDYYVRRPGGAQNEAGFHRFLADFLQIQLPQVSTTSGTTAPLYLETIFPFSYVEQKVGWSGTKIRVPTHFQIVNVGKRATEFVLGLSVLERSNTSNQLKAKRVQLEKKWDMAAERLRMKSQMGGFVLSGPSDTPRSSSDSADVGVVVQVEGAWFPLPEAIQHIDGELAELSERGIRDVQDVAPELAFELNALEDKLRDEQGILAGVSSERALLARQITQVRERIAALKDDLRKHQDSRTLQSLGSRLGLQAFAEHECPTCHQTLMDGYDITPHAMTVDQSIEFIRGQLDMFEKTEADLVRSTNGLSMRVQQLRESLSQTRSAIRTVRTSLTSPNTSPSTFDIQRRIVLEGRINELRQFAETLSESREYLQALLTEWKEVEADLSSSKGSEVNESDKEILSRLERTVRSQLGRYGFTSIQPNDVSISEETYRPTFEGFDLGFDLSASDMVRLIWAYLSGMLEVGFLGEGGHLGLLILDEPKQQDAAVSSYKALLRHSVELADAGAQLLFATSESKDSIEEMLAGVEYNLIDIPSGSRLIE